MTTNKCRSHPSSKKLLFSPADTFLKSSMHMWVFTHRIVLHISIFILYFCNLIYAETCFLLTEFFTYQNINSPVVLKKINKSKVMCLCLFIHVYACRLQNSEEGLEKGRKLLQGRGSREHSEVLEWESRKKANQRNLLEGGGQMEEGTKDSNVTLKTKGPCWNPLFCLQI